MKRILASILIVLLMMSTAAVSVGAVEDNAVSVSDGTTISFDTTQALYAHGVLNSADTEAWQSWQSEHTTNLKETNSSVKYFFLPVSADNSKADIYNAYSEPVTVNGTEIAAGETAQINYEVGKSYSVTADNKTYTLKFMKSNAEAGIYINNSDADGNGTNLMTYLNKDKSRSAAATGAIVEPDGSIDNTSIKKIKGRGNTTWTMPKKSYNITYSDNVSIAGMSKGKKYSILANYQDDSLSRNRFLYDLSDAVGMPYASDSRYVDFYVNGFYWGSYQMCEKIEVGKNSLINDIDDEAYLNEDGTVNTDFPFVCEIDPNATDGDDYYVTCADSIKVTIKSPELNEGDTGYNEVKAYVKKKFNNFYFAVSGYKDISEIADVDSVAKLYLINEIGKNWDSGVSSLFFTWKQDENGTYKFFGSPVWDYDNSLGNAKGVSEELQSMLVDDYEEYTGWWCKYKFSYDGSYNLIACISKNDYILNAIPQIWFDDFVPALNDFFGKTDNGIMKSYKQYYSLIADSAEMNYQSGWALKTSNSWIADHTKLTTAEYDSDTHKMMTTAKKTYNNNFNGMFDYAVEWMQGRTAWLSEQFYPDNVQAEFILGDADLNGEISITDVTLIQKFIADTIQFESSQLKTADVTEDKNISIDDATDIQKYLAGLSSKLGEYFKNRLPSNISSEIANEIKDDERFGIDYYFYHVRISLLSDNNDALADSIINKYLSDDFYYTYDAEKGYIDTSLPKETLLNIANGYGDSVYISSPVYEHEWGIVSEQLLADMENASDTDEFLVSITFSDDIDVNDFLYKYLGNPDKYLYNSEYNELKVCATKAQLVALNEDPNGYCIDYFASNSGSEYGFVDGYLADRVNNASPNQKFNAVIILYDFDKESFSFDPQRNRIIKNYFSSTSRYDYDDFQGCIFIVATKEQLLALNESDEHIRISGFFDE